MEKVAIDEVDTQPNPMDVHSIRRPISQALEFSDFAMNYFELEPDESFSGGYHTHYDQEEVFYVEDGEATFETEDGDVAVGAGEVIRFGPGEFQHGYNDGDETVVGFAFGAPGAKHDWDEIESMVYCRACEETVAHGVNLTDAGAFEMRCTDCDNAFTAN
ncbi:Cupin domain-containing protein [Natronorubrum sediminis]|uniref:Cupin domain-containing protein n=1 Tax=Natronorubrum sediminis TaxID=640943 RepID=A0A1H6FWR2_9EURY|nr:cupin domain-containing protein [Natronorubrum sediminis]SEH14608.1 Cupin domain-containing protein [Natronorubrum sediminis]